jgi:hypothetical protein
LSKPIESPCVSREGRRKTRRRNSPAGVRAERSGGGDQAWSSSKSLHSPILLSGAAPIQRQDLRIVAQPSGRPVARQPNLWQASGVRGATVPTRPVRFALEGPLFIPRHCQHQVDFHSPTYRHFALRQNFRPHPALSIPCRHSASAICVTAGVTRDVPRRAAVWALISAPVPLCRCRSTKRAVLA